MRHDRTRINISSVRFRYRYALCCAESDCGTSARFVYDTIFVLVDLLSGNGWMFVKIEGLSSWYVCFE